MEVLAAPTCCACDAELLSLDLDAFCASVRLLSGEHAGATLERVEYEDMSKLAA